MEFFKTLCHSGNLSTPFFCGRQLHITSSVYQTNFLARIKNEFPSASEEGQSLRSS